MAEIPDETEEKLSLRPRRRRSRRPGRDEPAPAAAEQPAVEPLVDPVATEPPPVRADTARAEAVDQASEPRVHRVTTDPEQGPVAPEPVAPASSVPPAAARTQAWPAPSAAGPTAAPARRVAAEGVRLPQLPPLPPPWAAAVSGVLVGLVGGALTYVALQGCSTVRGRPTCGGPGFFLLVAILIAMVLAGALLLTAWKVGDSPGSTSFLAVGVTAVVSVLVLPDLLLTGWMFAVLPLLAAGAYAGSWWLTTQVADERPPDPPA